MVIPFCLIVFSGGGGLGKGQECTNGFGVGSSYSGSDLIAWAFGENASVPAVVSGLVLAVVFALAVVAGAIAACRKRDDFR